MVGSLPLAQQPLWRSLFCAQDECSPPLSSSLSLLSLGSSLEMSEKKLLHCHSEKQMLDSIMLKVSNLLGMKASG